MTRLGRPVERDVDGLAVIEDVFPQDVLLPVLLVVGRDIQLAQRITRLLDAREVLLSLSPRNRRHPPAGNDRPRPPPPPPPPHPPPPTPPPPPPRPPPPPPPPHPPPPPP